MSLSKSTNQIFQSKPQISLKLSKSPYSKLFFSLLENLHPMIETVKGQRYPHGKVKIPSSLTMAFDPQ